MSGTDDYRSWSSEAQEKALAALRAAEDEKWRPFYCQRVDCDGKAHDKWRWNHARHDQRPPTDEEWLVWLLMGGRGAGKTESISRLAHKIVRWSPRIAFIAPTGADLRDVTVEGESGLLATAPPGERPVYEPSKRRLTWPNGARGFLYSAEEPERLRGPQHHWAFIDEAAICPLIAEVWDNLMFGLRLGKRPRVVVATTPKPKPWLKELLKEPTTRTTRASTYANLGNLAPTFAQAILRKYEGTRLGRQELHAELLEDVEGALWNWGMIEALRTEDVPAMRRVVVGVDPAGSKKRSSDETGIVVCGHGEDDLYYVLADRSGRYSPAGWAQAVMAAHDEFGADSVVVETNFGGDMVVSNLRAADATPRIVEARARRGKALRAEPVVGRYERAEVRHAGAFPLLEDQMCFVAGTLVETDRGHVPIEEVQPGDQVWTRAGWAPVAWAGPTGAAKALQVVRYDGSVLACTRGHKVWTQGRGFVPAASVRPSDLLVVRPIPARTDTLSRGGVGGITAWLRGTTATLRGRFYTERYGRPITEPSLVGISSTTSTMPLVTTDWRTSPASRISTTGATTEATASASPPGIRSNTPLVPEQCGAGVSRVLSSALVVRPSTAPACVPSGVHGDAGVYSEVAEPVYDLTVAEGYPPEFFANGVLVHNCSWLPHEDRNSPDRVDAMVYAMTALMKSQHPASIANPSRLRLVV